MYYKNNIIVKDRSRQQRSSATPNCSSVTVNGGQPCMYTLESLVQNASWVIDLETCYCGIDQLTKLNSHSQVNCPI